jgi:hypothetical protein
MVWPLAFHQLVAVRDRRAFVEQHLEGHDFSAVPVGPQTDDGHFLEGVLEGHLGEWEFTHMSAEEAGCVLVVLGLMHMRVKCVIPEELGGDYEPEVSTCGAGVCDAGSMLIVVTVLPGAVVGHGRDVGGAVHAPSVLWLF